MLHQWRQLSRGLGRHRVSPMLQFDQGRITAVGTWPAPRHVTRSRPWLLVTPGWVDVHTHYDGQATWTRCSHRRLARRHHAPSMGNCGVASPRFAGPPRLVDRLMEGVENIRAPHSPRESSGTGRPSRYRCPRSTPFHPGCGTQVPHGAVRAYVMGERGRQEQPATREEIAAMKAIVKEAIERAALGFSTSRTLAHVAIDGEPVACTSRRRRALRHRAALGELRTASSSWHRWEQPART